MAAPEIIDTGYIVHRRRLRESSLLLEIFTRGHGRFGVVARGALGGKKNNKGGGDYVEFMPYAFAWSTKRDLPTLLRAEPTGRGYRYAGDRLFSAMYLNELIVRLVHRGDSDESGFSSYEHTLGELSAEGPLEPLLRRFEVHLLQTCGYGLELHCAIDTGEAFSPDTRYFYVPERGPLTRIPPLPHRVVSGETLSALSGENTWTTRALKEAKGLMRFLIGHHLGGRPLSSRELFRFSGEPQA